MRTRSKSCVIGSSRSGVTMSAPIYQSTRRDIL